MIHVSGARMPCRLPACLPHRAAVRGRPPHACSPITPSRFRTFDGARGRSGFQTSAHGFSFPGPGSRIEGGEAFSFGQKALRRKPPSIDGLHTKSRCNKDVTHVTAARSGETFDRRKLYRDGWPQPPCERQKRRAWAPPSCGDVGGCASKLQHRRIASLTPLVPASAGTSGLERLGNGCGGCG
jgi:hypothetical protein